MRVLGLLVLCFALASCEEKKSWLPPSALPQLSADLEDLAQLETKDEVLAFWRRHGWDALPQKREDLLAQGFKIPDQTYYPFVERYGAPIWLKTSGRQAVFTVYVDKSGWVTYRTIARVSGNISI